jgi:hypothetical protein
MHFLYKGVQDKQRTGSTMGFGIGLNKMARELKDSTILPKISMIEDVIVISGEYHYHLECLVTFKNNHRSAQRANNSDKREDETKAFEELVTDIESPLKGGDYIFKFSELQDLYFNSLQNLANGDCQEQTDCKNTFVVFNKGLKKLLKGVTDSSNLETEELLMTKLVKVIRKDMNDLDRENVIGS